MIYIVGDTTCTHTHMQQQPQQPILSGWSESYDGRFPRQYRANVPAEWGICVGDTVKWQGSSDYMVVGSCAGLTRSKRLMIVHKKAKHTATQTPLLHMVFLEEVHKFAPFVCAK